MINARNDHYLADFRSLALTFYEMISNSCNEVKQLPRGNPLADPLIYFAMINWHFYGSKWYNKKGLNICTQDEKICFETIFKTMLYSRGGKEANSKYDMKNHAIEIAKDLRTLAKDDNPVIKTSCTEAICKKLTDTAKFCLNKWKKSLFPDTSINEDVVYSEIFESSEEKSILLREKETEFLSCSVEKFEIESSEVRIII
jgi:hypothetical protein